ncbi:M20/M25/M40 family metallo-hydrolase [Novosphingobium sp.]|uniref:M20/M25/M40 family metallo-hydrolase n=1 Tax=Novosphingobium sp. TaxID=1874826 RepID=UPI00333FC132
MACALGLAPAPAAASDAVTAGASAGETTAHAILRELLAIDTTREHGTAIAVEALRARFLAAGFAPGDVTVVAPADAPARPSLIVRLRGRDAHAKALLYLCHLDVVAAKPSDWTVPPFAMTERDGWIYGRGAIDMKGEDANVVAALIRLKTEKYTPARDVIAAFTPDEEGGGAAGIAFLLAQHRDLIDAGLVLNPDAGRAAFRGGRYQSYGFETSEKLFVSFAAQTSNRGGHSSEPRPDNAIYQLSAALGRVAAFRFPTRLTDTVRAQYAALGKLQTGPRRPDMIAVGSGDLAAADRLSDNPTDNAAVRTTCVATQLSGGHAENALPQTARATLQCRMLPGDTTDQVQAALVGAINDPGVTLSVITPAKPAPESPPSPAVWSTIADTVHTLLPGLPVMPDMDAGASDSIYTRAAGVPSYGVASLFDDIDDYRAHGRDERVSAERFVLGGELTYRLIVAFSRPGAPGS